MAGKVAVKVAVMEMDSVVGLLLLGVQGDALCFLEFLDEQQREQQLTRLSQTFAADIQPGENAVLARAASLTCRCGNRARCFSPGSGRR
jgi:hypothetical protein